MTQNFIVTCLALISSYTYIKSINFGVCVFKSDMMFLKPTISLQKLMMSLLNLIISLLNTTINGKILKIGCPPIAHFFCEPLQFLAKFSNFKNKPCHFKIRA